MAMGRISRESERGFTGVGPGEAIFREWANQWYNVYSNYWLCENEKCGAIFDADLKGKCPKCRKGKPRQLDFIILDSFRYIPVFVDGSVHDKPKVERRDHELEQIMINQGRIFFRITNEQLKEWQKFRKAQK